MTARAQRSSASPPLARWRALLVLGLLAGLLAMHALAPGGAVHDDAGLRHTTAGAVSTAHDDCPDGHCGGGHVQHADPTCMAGAVSGGPVLPALAADPVPAPDRGEAASSRPTVAPDGARAPPSLAELQLLRI